MSIFQPFTFSQSGKTALNRIALAPMTNGQSNAGGTLGEDEYLWLTRRAAEGFGIIFTCAAHVTRDGQGWPGELGIWSDNHQEGLKRLSKGIQKHGSLAIVQLFHGGARSPETITGKVPWSASAHSMTVGDKIILVREGTEDEIHQIIDAFVLAAKRAYEAGMDGIELHGAHGYLIHQFISNVTNQRTDEWGGSFENRTRLLVMILQKIKKELPKNFIVGVRISPEDKYTFKGIDFDESLDLALILKKEGADFLDISTWDSFAVPQKYPDSPRPVITWFRERLGSTFPLFVAGEIWSVEEAEKAMELGADFVSLGRVAIGVADWPKRAKNNSFTPQKPPYSISELQAASLGENFIHYMKKWKGFVKE